MRRIFPVLLFLLPLLCSCATRPSIRYPSERPYKIPTLNELQSRADTFSIYKTTDYIPMAVLFLFNSVDSGIAIPKKDWTPILNENDKAETIEGLHGYWQTCVESSVPTGKKDTLGRPVFKSKCIPLEHKRWIQKHTTTVFVVGVDEQGEEFLAGYIVQGPVGRVTVTGDPSEGLPLRFGLVKNNKGRKGIPLPF